MSSQVVTFYEDEAKTNALYPRTKVSAISDDNGTALSELIKSPWIDTSRLLACFDGNTYTAIEDCYLFGCMGVANATVCNVFIDDKWVGRYRYENKESVDYTFGFPLKQGQVVTITNATWCSLYVYGIKR